MNEAALSDPCCALSWRCILGSQQCSGCVGKALEQRIGEYNRDQLEHLERTAFRSALLFQMWLVAFPPEPSLGQNEHHSKGDDCEAG